MERTFKALFHTRSGSDFEKLNFPEAEVVVKATYSLVSQGTERLVLTEDLDAQTAERMRIPHMLGEFGQKHTYGYSLVGQVVEGPEEMLNQFVHVLHPHQEYAFVAQADVTPLPENLDPKTATLLSNMETAINALWDGGVQKGDRVAVVGFGLIGVLTAQVCRLNGATVDVADVNPKRMQLAANQQFNLAGSNDYDVVFHCSATSAGLQKAIDLVKENGKVIELSWYGSRPVSIQLGGSFHYGRKSIVSSQVSEIPPSRRSTFDFKKRKKLAIDYLIQLNPGHLIDHEITYGQSPAFFDKLRKNEINSLTTLITY